MKERQAARAAALQALYLCEVGRTSPESALETFFAEHEPEAEQATRDFAAALVLGVVEAQTELDALITAHSANWRIKRLAVIDRIVLRLGAWELQHRPDTPDAVVLDEAIELARAFGTDESPKFVNGVLDAIKKQLRGPRTED